MYSLRSIENEMGRSGSGSTFKAITKKELRVLSIPLSPLAEQHRIVAHLEAVQERIQTLKQAQEETEARLEELESAILDKAFRGDL